MNLPRGNVLLKPTSLDLDDFKVNLANLQHHEFNGYVLAALSGADFYVFLRRGSIQSIVEFSRGTYGLISELFLNHRLRKAECSLASYVLAPDLVDVLSKAYSFQEVHRNYPVSKVELNKLLAAAENEKLTGLLEVQNPNNSDSIYLLFHEGKIATDNFLDIYGQILTGADKVFETLEFLSTHGGVINFYGETPNKISAKEKTMTDAFNQFKELTVSVDSSGFLFGGGNGVRIDEKLLHEWSPGGALQKVEVLLEQGASEVFKVSGKKGLGNKLSIPSGIQKKFGFMKEEPVLVKPA